MKKLIILIAMLMLTLTTASAESKKQRNMNIRAYVKACAGEELCEKMVEHGAGKWWVKRLAKHRATLKSLAKYKGAAYAIMKKSMVRTGTAASVIKYAWRGSKLLNVAGFIYFVYEVNKKEGKVCAQHEGQWGTVIVQWPSGAKCTKWE